MDPLLSFIMSNMGCVTANSIVYDPFVGTGSLLVAASYYGAYVAGADLDYNLIHAKGLSSRKGQKYRKKEETIYNNLKQYGLEKKFLDILVADFSTKYIRESFKFDAIITDPPYGIREKTKKVGNHKNKSCLEEKPIDKGSQTKEEGNFERQDDLSDENENNELKESGNYYPRKTKYCLGDIYDDLLLFAVRNLKESGKLVFWMPIYLEIDRKKLR
jgi:tRNA (guanine10-N2)-methyltransferase